ncbi:MAG: TrkH family potassium uptake protein, partial [Lachnospiraceae bacterium]|nr:TrkH family potassium uptake protein [Lachnospiraceae bacterium]
MNYKLIGNILGKVLLAEGGLLVLPLIAALCFGESVLPFVITMIPLFIIGAVLARIKPASENLFAKEGFVCVGLSWILMSV